MAKDSTPGLVYALLVNTVRCAAFGLRFAML